MIFLGLVCTVFCCAACLQCSDAVGWPVKKTEWWGAGMVICLERGADLHMAQLMPLPLTVSCFSKIRIGFTFLVPAHLGSPGKGPLNGCVCLCVVLPAWRIKIDVIVTSFIVFAASEGFLLIQMVSIGHSSRLMVFIWASGLEVALTA